MLYYITLFHHRYNKTEITEKITAKNFINTTNIKQIKINKYTPSCTIIITAYMFQTPNATVMEL